MTTFRIGHRFQGPSGTGQGGWTSALFERTIGEPLTISIRRGIPLETDLEVIEVPGGWELHDDGPGPVMTARPRTEPFVDTEPVSIDVMTYGTGVVSDPALVAAVRETFDLRPQALIRRLDLLRPIYRPTAAYGHFGRDGFPWEELDHVDALKQATAQHA